MSAGQPEIERHSKLNIITNNKNRRGKWGLVGIVELYYLSKNLNIYANILRGWDLFPDFQSAFLSSEFKCTILKIQASGYLQNVLNWKKIQRTNAA